MKALTKPIRYHSSCYEEKFIQDNSSTYSTLMFLVLKVCLRDVVFFFCLVSLYVCMLSKCTVQHSLLSPSNRP